MNWLLAAAALGAAAPERLAVLEVGHSGIDPELADVVAAALVTRVAESGRFEEVVSARELRQLLDFEAQRQLLGCDDIRCFAEIAGALGVGRVLSVSFGRLGDTLVVNLSLIDSSTARTEARVTEESDGGNDTLLATMGRAVDRLFPPKSSGLPRWHLAAAGLVATPLVLGATVAAGAGVSVEAVVNEFPIAVRGLVQVTYAASGPRRHVENRIGIGVGSFYTLGRVRLVLHVDGGGLLIAGSDGAIGGFFVGPEAAIRVHLGAGVGLHASFAVHSAWPVVHGAQANRLILLGGLGVDWEPGAAASGG